MTTTDDSEQTGLARVAVRSSLWGFAGTGTQAVAQFVSIMVLARLLDSFEYGLATAALLVVGLLGLVAQAGIAPAIVQKEEIDDCLVATGAWLSLALGSVLAGGLVLATPLINTLLGLPGDERIISWLALQLPLLSLEAVPMALLQRQLRLSRVVLVQTCTYVLGVVLVSICLANAGAGAHSIIWGHLVTTFLTVVAFMYLAPHTWRVGGLRAFRDSSRILLRYGGPYSAGSIGTWFADSGDKFVVGNTIGPVGLGVYGRVYQFVSVGADIIGGVLDRVLFPSLSRIQRDLDRMRDAYVSAAAIVMLAVLPPTVVTLWSAHAIISLLLGPGWEEGALPLQILAAALLPRASYKLSDSLARAAGQVSGMAVRQWLFAVVAVVCALIGSPWGLAGIAAGTVSALFIHHGIMLVFAHSVCPGLLPAVLRMYLRYIPLFAAMNLTGFGVSVLIADSPPILGLMAQALTACAVAGAWVVVLRPWFRHEARLLVLVFDEFRRFLPVPGPRPQGVKSGSSPVPDIRTSARPSTDAIVILSSVRWNFTWQRHHALARSASSAGHRTVFVEPHPRGLRHILAWLLRDRRGGTATPQSHSVPPGVTVVDWSPLDLLPSVRRRRITRALGEDRRDRTRVIVHLPSRSSLHLAERLSSGTLIYDRVLDWANVPAQWFPPRSWDRVEALFEARGHVVTDAQEYVERLREQGRDALLVMPCTDEEFERFPWSRPPPDGAIGYFGTIREDVIDVERVIALAQARRVEIVGDVDARSAQRLTQAGAHVQGPVDVSSLPPIIDEWSAVLLPYRADSGRDSLVPAKLWNCIATRRPVLAIGLELPVAAEPHVRFLDSAPLEQLLRPSVGTPPVPTWEDAWLRIAAFAEIKVDDEQD